jgi:hypothetical protein
MYIRCVLCIQIDILYTVLVVMYSVKVVCGAYSITYCFVFTLECHLWYVLCTVVVVFTVNGSRIHERTIALRFLA